MFFVPLYSLSAAHHSPFTRGLARAATSGPETELTCDWYGVELFRLRTQLFMNKYISVKYSLSLICSLQTTLATFGIETQTPQQIEPIQIWPPSELVKVIFLTLIIHFSYLSLLPQSELLLWEANCPLTTRKTVVLPQFLDVVPEGTQSLFYNYIVI